MDGGPGTGVSRVGPALNDDMTMEELETELKHFIVDSLELEDVTPEEINSDAPLFVEGLGLDSIDALDLALVLGKKYGVKFKADDEQNRYIFTSIRTLATYIQDHRNPKVNI